MRILGINAYHGDSSCALFEDGLLTAAVEEERFNRIKHWAGLPVESVKQCLEWRGVDRLDHVAVSRDPSAHLWKKVGRVVMRPGLWANAAARTKNLFSVSEVMAKLQAEGIAAVTGAQFHKVEHHRSHLASAFFCSPFEQAAVISIDGFGDFSSAMWGVGKGNEIEVLGSVAYPHSLGLFYTAFTQFLGFRKYGDEYKMMGLSAYGEPRYVKDVRKVVSASDGGMRLNLEFFRHDSEGVDMSWAGGEPTLGQVYSERFEEVFGEPRKPGAPIETRHMDLAASAQMVLEEVYFALLSNLAQLTQQKAVCLAGGVALNCVANGMVLERTDFKDVYVQPAAHDAGTSIGAALYVQHQVLNQPRRFEMRHVYYGTEFADDEIRRVLEQGGLTFSKLTEAELVARTAREIERGGIVGWFQGRMEFGPRALGNRSILADPRRENMKDILNSRIKYREPFRPFCPSVLAECTGEWFEMAYPSPFMVMAYKIRSDKRVLIPAVTHGDGTGRLQTVEKSENPIYWNLIDRFRQLTDIPILLNTSFNENEPIVNTPQEAVDCFLRTKMDVLSIGSYLLLKQDNEEQSASRRAFGRQN